MHLNNSPSDFLTSLKELVYVRTVRPVTNKETDLQTEKEINQAGEEKDD